MGNESTMDAMSPIDIKKRTALLQPLLTLKSNTMKKHSAKVRIFRKFARYSLHFIGETMLFNIERLPVYSYLQNRMPSL